MNTTDRSCLCIGGVLDGGRHPLDGRTLAAPRPHPLAREWRAGPLEGSDDLVMVEKDLYRPEVLTFTDGQQRYFWVLEGMTVLEATDRLIEFYRPK